MTPPEEIQNTSAFTIRSYLPEDHPGVINVIKSVMDEYNYIMDFGEFDSDLVDIQSTYQDPGGEFWVLEIDHTIAGTVAAMPRQGETCELKRLYLLKGHRGRGWGRRLMETMLGWARLHGFRRVVLWSDVLFEPAHNLYLKAGFRPTQETRSIDPNNPSCVERFFVRKKNRGE
ncbi:MAG: GNAT family N-acetyltransferase [bacterium]|nr:MAG: GNAT family N-acetyltransferase [bacterium]